MRVRDILMNERRYTEGDVIILDYGHGKQLYRLVQAAPNQFLLVGASSYNRVSDKMVGKEHGPHGVTIQQLKSWQPAYKFFDPDTGVRLDMATCPICGHSVPDSHEMEEDDE